MQSTLRPSMAPCILQAKVHIWHEIEGYMCALPPLSRCDDTLVYAGFDVDSALMEVTVESR